MNIQQLRIGNLVRWKYGEDEYNTIHAIDPEQIDLQIITPFGVHPDDIEGIPLSEGWLGRFGFEFNNKDNIYFKDIDKYWSIIALDAEDFSASIYCSQSALDQGMDACLSGSVTRYVHQLQNLIYALTGKELTLKTDQ